VTVKRGPALFFLKGIVSPAGNVIGTLIAKFQSGPDLTKDVVRYQVAVRVEIGMAAASVLIIETQNRIFDRFGPHLARCGYRIERIACSDNLGAERPEQPFDAFIAGDPAPAMSVTALLDRLQQLGATAPVIIVGDPGSARQAVEAIHAGAGDYLAISENESVLEKSISNLLELKEYKTKEKDRKSVRPRIVAKSAAIGELLDMARRIAPSAATVLIQGESGTGKELLARFIHEHSARGENPLVAMNCAALPDTLAESELFGYERGAFTGAVRRKSGKFELAHQGTLLLDEIGEMPLPLQAKLLRVLQEREVDPIGGRRPIPVDVRVIATTNRDLVQMVKEGRFRQDLFFRLRIVPLIIPPLRSRAEDVVLLADYFIRKYAPANDGPLPRFSAAAMDKIRRWQWPGNVRELENAIQRAVLIRTGDTMGPEHLLLEHEVAAVPPNENPQLVGMTVKELEERLIVQTLDHVGQNRTHAAQLLGISIRTLRNKLAEYRQAQAPSPRSAAGRC